MVPKSKTAAGTGRVIPLTCLVCACLTLWLSRFPDAGPGSLVFPFHQVGIRGNSRTVEVYDVDLNRPMGSWRKAWLIACRKAGVHYRWHDLRHTFVSRLAENPTISEQTIRSLAGHVSRQNAGALQPDPLTSKAGRNSLPRRAGERADFGGDRGQKWAQFGGETDEVVEANSLEANDGPLLQILNRLLDLKLFLASLTDAVKVPAVQDALVEVQQKGLVSVQ